MLAGPTAARARSPVSKRSMCQNSGSLRLPASGLFSMMLQPISPRRSGEFSTHQGSSCADTLLVVTIRKSVAATKHGLLHMLICLVVFTDEDGGAENGGPEAALVADGGLCDVHGADDFVGDAVDFFFFVETQIRIEFHIESGREHFRGQFFRVLAGDLFGFPEGMMLG